MEHFNDLLIGGKTKFRNVNNKSLNILLIAVANHAMKSIPKIITVISRTLLLGHPIKTKLVG